MIFNYLRKLRKKQRGLTFHRQLIKPGDLVFDIGAHEGERTSAFQYLGARVITVEPQSEIFQILEERFADAKLITLINKAVADVEGREEIWIGNNSQFSSLSEDFIQQIPNLDQLKWDKKEWIEVTTLDRLIQKFGVPEYIKIDVRGYEVKVLNGLSTAVIQISFKYTFPFKKEAILCISIIDKLGDYQFNFMPFEEMAYQLPTQVSSSEIIKFIEQAPEGLLTGEVFAFLNS